MATHDLPKTFSLEDKSHDMADGPGLFVSAPGVLLVWQGYHGEGAAIAMDLAVCATYLDIIDKYGIEHAQNVLRAGVNMARAPREEAVYEAEKQREEHNIASMLQALDRNREKLANSEEDILDLSYRQLLFKQWTREEAAENASTLLQRPISTEAWRKRVDRWAEARGRPPLGQTKRRSRRLSGHEHHKGTDSR